MALAVLTLPYSFAMVERTFSALGDIKIAKRNSLFGNNLEACLLIHHELKNKKEFQVMSQMISHLSHLWDRREDFDDLSLFSQKEIHWEKKGEL